MSILGIESVLYACDDLEIAERFWTDFGLAPVRASGDERVFETPEGATIVVKRPSASAMPPSPAADPTVRETTFSVSDAGDVAAIAERLKAHGYPAELTPDGRLRTRDPNGYALAFAVTAKRAIPARETLFNNPTSHRRVDVRANIAKRARPMHLAHVVYLCPKLHETYRFYEQGLGFVLTDMYDHGQFYRCPGAIDHHNVFVLNVENVHGFHHISFDVQDVHELFGGGSYLDKKGWKTHIGPGRHPVSSAYFWYFVNPCGGAAEYDFDADLCTDAWEPRHFPPTPESFAEWAVPDGLEAVSYRGAQTTSVEDDAKATAVANAEEAAQS